MDMTIPGVTELTPGHFHSAELRLFFPECRGAFPVPAWAQASFAEIKHEPQAAVYSNQRCKWFSQLHRWFCWKMNFFSPLCP